jgi:hypothetical protein
MAQSLGARRLSFVATLLACVGTAALARPALAVVNTHQDASTLPFVACNGRVGFRTNERQQANIDLTGDGDGADLAFQVLTLSSGTVTNVGIEASGPLACGGDVFAFGVSETGQQNLDRNGDGDTFDTVLAVYDAGTATLTNVGLAVTAVFASDQLIAFTVNEASQGGADENGDGDVNDHVLHVLDPATMTVTNLGIATADDVHVVVAGQRVAFFASEAAQGNTDLNGDGDAGDTVVMIYDAATATLINPHQAVAASLGVQMDGTAAVFAVDEASQGASSLNGDADASDQVLAIYCFATPACTTTGLINVGMDAGGGFTLGGDLVAMRTRERNQPGASLNPPDTDERDTVVQYYRLSTGQLANTQLAGQARVRILGNLLLFGVPERLQDRQDLDGDGDLRDVILTQYDTITQTATSTGRALWSRSCRRDATLATPKGPCTGAGTDLLAFANGEKEQGKTDLNGDLDFHDAVIGVWRPSTSTFVSTGLAADTRGILVTGGQLAAFLVSERRQSNDLNGDHDHADRIIAVYNGATQVTTSLGQAADAPVLVEGQYVVFRTRELEQNVDLNGDGDLGDAVLQYQMF